jgi:rare lipoprotein A
MRVLLAMAMFCVAGSMAHAESGIASVYGGRDGYCGKPVASGGVLNCQAMTAAHKTLPFNTMVKVTMPATGNYTIVHINDRGPNVKGRIIDLTPAAARALGCHGLCRVTIEALR